MEFQLTTLGHLIVGQQATIMRIDSEKVSRKWLMDMGLMQGETITVERVAPMGDPIEILVKGYYLSLCKDEARRILVKVHP